MEGAGGMIGALRKMLKPLVRRTIAIVSLFTRPMTLGVRAAVFDEAGRVFLVRHTYVPGWYLPGGGVDVGETMPQAAIRELREEGNIFVAGRPELFGIYLNVRHSKRNHVALYVIRDWRQPAPPKLPSLEIAEIGFFDPENLPSDTTPATIRHLAEIAAGVQSDDVW